MSYFSRKQIYEKSGEILRDTRSIVWEPTTSEFAALIRELHLIRMWRPKWNVTDRPRNLNPKYLCIGRAPAKYLYLAGRPANEVTIWYGPLYRRRLLDPGIEALNDYYQLRDCSQKQPLRFRDDRTLFVPEEAERPAVCDMNCKPVRGPASVRVRVRSTRGRSLGPNVF